MRPPTATYDVSLLVLSGIIALFSAYAALDDIDRLRQGIVKRTWLRSLRAACILGIGIWTSHFVATFANGAVISVNYRLAFVLLSLLWPIVVNFLFVRWLTLPHGQRRMAKRLWGSILFVVAVLGMHVLGMTAMMGVTGAIHMPSLTLAGLFCLCATWLTLTLESDVRAAKWRRLAATALLACANIGTHVIASMGVRFDMKSGTLMMAMHGISSITLAGWLAMAVFAVICLMLVALISGRQVLERAWRTTDELLKSIVEGAPLAIVAIDMSRHVRLWNGGAEALFGWRASEVLGAVNPVVPADDTDFFMPRLLAHGHVDGAEVKRLRKDGATVDVAVWGKVMYDDNLTPIGIIGIYLDVTERKRSEQARVESERRFGLLLQSSPDAIVIHRQYVVEYANEAAAQLLGYASATELIGHNILEFAHPDDISKKPWHLDADRLQVGDMVQSGEDYRLVRRDGEPFYAALTSTVVLDEGRKSILTIARDRTERRAAERRLRFMAYHDALTGLPNRRRFRELADVAIATVGEQRELFAVLCIDIDRFKHVNDSFGHEFGDALLRIVAKRLTSCLPDATLSRLSGDEFTMFTLCPSGVDDAIAAAKTIMEALNEPVSWQDIDIHLTPSIGIAIYPEAGRNADVLLGAADGAMHLAKALGGNQYQVHIPEVSENSMRRLRMEADMRKALTRNEFSVYYQPKIDPRTGDLLGAEALIRWTHPERGMVMPQEFIPLTEETGFILPLGEWVLETVCMQNRAWQDEGLPPIRIAVNVSARQFRQRDLQQVILRVLTRTQLPANCLEIEITESTLMAYEQSIDSMIDELRGMGVTIAIDDFGTGYSSLGYLKRFALDTLKLDKSFVRDMTVGSHEASIVSAVIALAHNLHISVVAEGVETEEQLTYLREQGCDAVQGYYLLPPVPTTAFSDFYRSRTAAQREAASGAAGE